MSVWSEAVSAVPHSRQCAVHVNNSDDSPYCDCDRDERIGHGLENAVIRACLDGSTGWFPDDDVAVAALAAFKEAAR